MKNYSLSPQRRQINIVITLIIASAFLFSLASIHRADASPAPGDLDTLFNPGNGVSGPASVSAIAIQSDGKVIIGGNFIEYNGESVNNIIRVNDDGSLDPTFVPGAGANDSVTALAIQLDGKVIIGGDFTEYDGTLRYGIARLNSDGSLDGSFDPGLGTDNSTEAIVLQPDGKVLIGGYFSSFNGTASYGIVRLNDDGSMDTSFETGTGAGGAVLAIIMQPDDKVLIGGGFTDYNGTAINNIARLNSDGSMDTTFNSYSGVEPVIYTLALQTDGKLLIGGDFTEYDGVARNYIARLENDGSLDTTFDSGSGTNNTVVSILLQPDNKVLIGGGFSDYNGTMRMTIARLNNNGSLDTTFDPGTGTNDSDLTFALQIDGKVLLGGGFSVYNSTTRNGIARLNDDASLDTNFDPGSGVARGWGIVESISLQPDDKVLIGGVFTDYNGTARKSIARLNNDGSLDTTFDPGSGVDGAVLGIALQTDGKVFISGNIYRFTGIARNNIIRLNSNGSLDTTFDPGTGTNMIVKAIELQPDGKLLIAGFFTEYNGTARNHIARLNNDGSLDTTFDPGSGVDGPVLGIGLQTDGKVLIAGSFTDFNGTVRNGIARLNSDGSLDTTFDPGLGVDYYISSFSLQPDSKILIGGFFTDYNGTARNNIARLNSDGSLDTTFNPSTGANARVYAMALQTDGKVLISGIFTQYNGVSSNHIARLNSDGSLDTTFNPGTGANNTVWPLSLQPNGKLLIGGSFTDYDGTPRNRIARLELAFTPPASFNKSDPGTASISQPLNLTLNWGASDGATSYDYCYDIIDNNSCDESWVDNAAVTSTNLSNLDQGTIYFWQVRANNSFGTIYANNDTWWTFTTGDQPEPFYKNAPTDGITNRPLNLNLSWGISNQATGYEYCYDLTNNNTCDGSWVNNGLNTSASLSNLSQVTTYYWQVRAVNSFGTMNSDNSNWWSFTTGAAPGSFDKSSPTNEVVDQPESLPLIWGESTGAESYEVCADTINNNICDGSWTDLETSRIVNIINMSPGITYYWQVRARNSISITYANNNTWWSFTTGNMAGAFIKIDPSNGTIDQPTTLTLNWGASIGVTNYEYCYDTDNDNFCSGLWVDNGTNISANLSGLSQGTTYYWQVRATNSFGSTYADGSSTARWSFTTGTAPGAFGKNSPSNGAANQPSSISLSWGASSLATGYEYCYDTSNNNTCDGSWVDSGSSTTASISGLSQYITYYWQVRANNNFDSTEADNGTWWSFSVGINDPLYSQQWGLEKIRIAGAWNETQGSSSIIIAILDTGIDLTHPDLADQIWVNPGEIPDNGLDDDNNGYVDDVNGWNFVSATNDISDNNGHGTLVAGVATAAAENGQGIAGVCPLCRIMPIKVTSASGNANYSDIAAGILYAAQKGAKVINISAGGYAGSTLLRNAIDAAVNTYDVVVVVGSGNDNLNQLYYPAAYDGVLAVTGTRNDDTKASFSNYGIWVDVSAPAMNILTTAMGGDWVNVSGTSMSTAYASGLAGLIRTLHPEWSQALVRSQIIHSADNIDSLNPGYIGLIGSGRLDATSAMQSPHPILAFSGYSVNGENNGRPPKNASSSLTIALTNDWFDALGVAGTLTTTDPWVTITNDTASFGDIAAGARFSNTTPFSINIAEGAGYNHSIPFTLTVTETTGYSTSFEFTVMTETGVVNKSGTIIADETWTNDKTYLITNNVNIPAGVSLSIQPGTTVKFNGNYSLNVRGTLLADGTSSQPILFKYNTTGLWNNILFDDTSTDATTAGDGIYLSGSILRYVTIDSSSGGIDCTNATPYLSQVNLSAGGIVCSLGSTPMWFQDNTIIGNVSFTGPVNAFRNIISGGLSISGTGTAQDNVVNGGSLSLGGGTASRNSITGGALTVSGSAGSIENNSVGGNVSAGASFSVLNNTISGSLTAGNNAVVDHNAVSNGISVGSSAIVTWNNVENGGIGLAAGTDVTARYNRLIGNTTGMTASTGLIEHNLIANNTGVGLQVGAATVRYNTFTGNQGNTIVVQGMNPVTIEYNNLEGNTGTFELYVNIASGVTVPAENNWWGTTDNLVITNRIYDWQDDDTKAQVTYTLKLSSPDQTAPAYVRNVTVLPDTTLGIQTGTFDVVFSRPMDTNNDPLLSFHDERRGETLSYPVPIGKHWHDEYTNAFLIANQDKVYIGASNWMPTSQCDLNSAQGGQVGFGVIDQDGNWTMLLSGNYLAGNKDMHGNIYFANLQNVTSTEIVELDSDGLWHHYALSIGYPNFVHSIKFDTDGNVYIDVTSGNTSCTSYLFVLSPSGTFIPFSGEPLSGSWWTPSIPQNIDQFGNIWYFPSKDETWGVRKYFIGYDYDVEDSFNWLSSTIHQSTYEFTSLLPKANYVLSVDSAFGSDGIETAPTANTIFTVDYAGSITDKTPPTKPIVTAGGDGSLTTLSASWSSSDPDSPISMYRYAIGTGSGLRDVVNWTNTTGVTLTRTGLNLTYGQKYYVSVQARNDAGLWSESGISNFIIAGIATTISGNTGVVGTTLTYTDGIPKIAITDGSGNYSITVSYNWSGTVTPLKTGCVFLPVNRTYTNVLENHTDQNYLATYRIYLPLVIR